MANIGWGLIGASTIASQWVIGAIRERRGHSFGDEHVARTWR